MRDASLASTFNRMLYRLESAFAAQRRFLDGAGPNCGRRSPSSAAIWS
ncbi:hypothetical protein [Actinomadura sp. 6K520]|nr:hypothetical protein [Actinomadura sp. 6K520]